MEQVVAVDRYRGRARMQSKKQAAKVISITSGKGGVGKTHTTVNLGLSLAREGKKVLLLDADLGLANINIMLGFQPDATLDDIIQGKAGIRDVIVTKTFGSSKKLRLDVIPASSGISDVTHLDEGERVRLLASFEEIATEYDYLLVDTGAGIGSNVMYFNVASERILVVIDHEPTSITDAYALIKVLATEWGVKEFDVLVNRTPLGNPGKAPFAKLAGVSDKFLPVRLNFLGTIVDDESMSEAVIQQRPVTHIYPNSRVARDYQRLAKKISETESSRSTSGGMQFFFESIMAQG